MIYDSIYPVACSTAVSQGQICQLFTPVMVSFLGHTHSHRPLLETDSDKHHQNIPAKETDPVTLESGLVSPCKLQNSHLWPDTAVWGDVGGGCQGVVALSAPACLGKRKGWGPLANFIF